MAKASTSASSASPIAEAPPLTPASPLVPSEPSKAKLLLRSACILGSEFCERLAYYSISANLVLFFVNSLKLNTALANTLQLAWTGTCYVTPLLGGWIADSFAGRWLTILVFMGIYIAGMASLAVGAIPAVATLHAWVALSALFVIALGTGGIKANVVTFGADQFSDVPEAKAEPMKQSFFNWFYFSINIGSLLSFTAIAYVQQEISFTVGLAIPAAVMFLSAVIFGIGSRWYIRLLPSGSVVSQGLSIVYNSIVSHYRREVNVGSSFLDRAKNARNLRNGSRLFTETQVEDMKALLNVVPVFLTFILFWTVYAQMSSLIFTQGLVMNLKIKSFTLPASSLNVFNSAPILLLIPLLDRGIYPLLRRHNVNFSVLRRIGTGFCLATLAMVYSGLLEMYRLNLIHKGDTITQKIGDKIYTAANISVFAQVPCFMLVGAGEVFASVGGLEFAYNQAPKTMRSLIQAMFLLTTAFGSYIGSAIVAIVNAASHPNWISENLNESRLDYYFYLLACLSAVNFGIYVWISLRYRVAEPSLEEIVSNAGDGDEGGNGMPDDEKRTLLDDPNDEAQVDLDDD